MTSTNQDVRNAVKASGVRYWQVADALGMADCTFSRKLRRELPEETKQQIFEIIENLKEGGGSSGRT